MGKLKNGIPGSRLLISSISKPRDSTSVLEVFPGKLDIKRLLPSFLYIFCRRMSPACINKTDLSLSALDFGNVSPQRK